MIYEIINPSDAVTIKSDNLVNAGVACWLVSSAYGLHDETGETVLPIAIFGGQDEWFKEHGVDNSETYIMEHKEEIADVLETVMYGRIEERSAIEHAMSKMSPEKAEEYIRELNERRRTSLNNIEAACLSLARKLRKLVTV